MQVKVPKYDEFKAEAIWKQIKNKPKYNVYFKEYTKKGCPNREYMFNVLKSILAK